ncbi:MAG: hypothetical protein HQL44_03720 [Alphaproteobacteria bacterium]|nr:hypothetical protein [Alphaproteobacteria bacterium]
MNKMLERAIAQAVRLPEDAQETLASLMLGEMESERVRGAVLQAMNDPAPSIDAKQVFAEARARLRANENSRQF